jgi:hypothetical protein
VRELVATFIKYPSYFDHVEGQGDIKETAPIVSSEVVPANSGLIWSMNMSSIEEVAEADQGVFDKIIQSFRFLD